MRAGTAINCTFGGTKEDWATMADMVGTTTAQLEMDGMRRHIAAFVGRERGDPLKHANMQTTRQMLVGGDVTLDRHLVCPTAYALARHAGYDPAAILLLETVRCDVTVDLPGWPDQLAISRGDTGDDVCGPVAPGFMWSQDAMDDEPRIRIEAVHTGLPDTLLVVLYERIAQRPLRDLISHPLLDGMDLGVAGMNLSDDETYCTLEISGAPAAVTLREAARLYDSRRNA